MEIILLIGVVVAVVWGLVAIKYQHLLLDRAFLFPLLGGAIILTGAVFSSEFLSLPGPIPITIDRLLMGGTAVGFFVMLVRGAKRCSDSTELT